MDAALGLQKVGVQQQVPNSVGILGGAEEVRLLLRVHHLPAAVGALAVHQLGFRPEGLAGLAVLALVGALVDVPVVVHLLEDLLDGFHVVRIGGADEPVVGDVHQLPQVQHAAGSGHDIVHKLLGSDPGLPGLVLNLLAVLVGAGEEHHVIALEPLVTGHDICGHGGIGVADVQLARGVVDGCGDIKFLVVHGWVPPVSLISGRGEDRKYWAVWADFPGWGAAATALPPPPGSGRAAAAGRPAGWSARRGRRRTGRTARRRR